ncbi:MAG: DUF1415 domain-containing protein [Pseudomonadota bacterium]
MNVRQSRVAASVQTWVEDVVVELNLCPFARRELIGGRVHIAESRATQTEHVLVDLETEIQRLLADDAIETTLLVLPHALPDFNDFNQFLDLADGLLQHMQLTGVLQLAHFHPDYRFADTDPGDAENFTNRSPYPILHLLRESSLDRVLRSTEHAEQIPTRNIELMNALGADEMRSRLARCCAVADD